jgi:hypothetical protein
LRDALSLVDPVSLCGRVSGKENLLRELRGKPREFVSGTFVGIERVRGAVGGRKGSFLLQISGTDLGKERKAEWFVIPGSGTGDLKGLRGEGGFEAQRGQKGAVFLDYYFE